MFGFTKAQQGAHEQRLKTSQNLGFMQATDKPFRMFGGAPVTPAELLASTGNPLDMIPGLDSRPGAREMLEQQRAERARMEAQGLAPGSAGTAAGNAASFVATVPYGMGAMYAVPFRQPAHEAAELARNAPDTLPPGAQQQLEALGVLRGIYRRGAGMFGTGRRPSP